MKEHPEDTPGAAAEQRSGREGTAQQLAFYRETTQEMRLLALRAGLSPTQAEDIVQMVVLKFLHHLPPFIPEKEPEQAHAWLVVARHEIASVFRDRGRHALEALDSLLGELPDACADDAEAAERARLLEELHKLLKELSESKSLNERLFVEDHIASVSIEELAQANRLTVSAIWKRLQRVRVGLRKRLARFRDEDPWN